MNIIQFFIFLILGAFFGSCAVTFAVNYLVYRDYSWKNIGLGLSVLAWLLFLLWYLLKSAKL